MPFDDNAAARARAAARGLPVPVEVTCGFCGVVCRDDAGRPLMTRDRLAREGACTACRRMHAAPMN